MQGSLRVKSVLSAIKSFVSDNKKVIICATIIFALGITVGVISAFGAVGDDGFERVARADMEFSSAKVFFVSLLALLGCYVVFLLSGINAKTIFLIVIPFFCFGVCHGRVFGCANSEIRNDGACKLTFDLFAVFPLYVLLFRIVRRYSRSTRLRMLQDGIKTVVCANCESVWRKRCDCICAFYNYRRDIQGYRRVTLLKQTVRILFLLLE